MSRVIVAAALVAPLALACDGLEPEAREVWEPDRIEVQTRVAPEALELSENTCGEVTRWHFAYDAAGNRVEAARAKSAEGMPSRLETRAFDDAGRIVSARADWAGPIDDRAERNVGFVEVALERDPDGRIVRRTVDSSDSRQRSVAELVERSPEREVIRYSGAVLLLEPFDPMTERTPDADDRAAVHDPLIDGNAMIEALVRRIDAGEGLDPLFDPFEVVETRTFDASGRLLAMTWDLDDDGVPEQAVTRAYDEVDGRERVTIGEDLDGDGEPDHVRFEFYEGELLVERVTDEGGDGTLDTRSLWSYDGEGGVTEELYFDLLADGLERPSRRTTHVRDAELVITEVDDNGDGEIDHRTELYTRADGKRVLKREDDKADGQVDWQKRYVYDEAGQRVFDERDRNVDGIADQRWDYGWDAAGRLIHEIGTEPASASCAGLRD